MKKRLSAVWLPLSVLWITALSGCIDDQAGYGEKIDFQTIGKTSSVERVEYVAKLYELKGSYGQFKEGHYGLPIPLSVIHSGEYGSPLNTSNRFDPSVPAECFAEYPTIRCEPGGYLWLLIWKSLPDLPEIVAYRRDGRILDKDGNIIDCPVPKSQEEADLIPKEIREAIIHGALDPNTSGKFRKHILIERQNNRWLPDREELMADYVSYLAGHFYSIMKGETFVWLETIRHDWHEVMRRQTEYASRCSPGTVWREDSMARERQFEWERQREQEQRLDQIERRQRKIESEMEELERKEVIKRLRGGKEWWE